MKLTRKLCISILVEKKKKDGRNIRWQSDRCEMLISICTLYIFIYFDSRCLFMYPLSVWVCVYLNQQLVYIFNSFIWIFFFNSVVCYCFLFFFSSSFCDWLKVTNLKFNLLCLQSKEKLATKNDNSISIASNCIPKQEMFKTCDLNSFWHLVRLFSLCNVYVDYPKTVITVLCKQLTRGIGESHWSWNALQKRSRWIDVIYYWMLGKKAPIVVHFIQTIVRVKKNSPKNIAWRLSHRHRCQLKCAAGVKKRIHTALENSNSWLTQLIIWCVVRFCYVFRSYLDKGFFFLYYKCWKK